MFKLKTSLTAAALLAMLAGPAFADDDDRRDRNRRDRYDYRHDRDDDDRRYDHRRYDDRRDHRGRRHVPPVRFRSDFAYRNGYELAWRDWERHGRYNRQWRRSHPSWNRGGYRYGYDEGWRDAARYFGHGYRPRYWARDPRGSWYFGFHIDG